MTRQTSPSPDLRYPIGRYAPPEVITEQHVDGWIDEIAALPADLRRTVASLTADQLDTPYRLANTSRAFTASDRLGA